MYTCPPNQLQRPSALSSKDLIRVRYHLPKRLLWRLVKIVFIWSIPSCSLFPSTHCARNWHFHAPFTKHSKCGCDSNQESSLSDELWITVKKPLAEGKCYYKFIGYIVYRFLKYLQSHIYLKREHINYYIFLCIFLWT